jgi:hypothetical protein
MDKGNNTNIKNSNKKSWFKKHKILTVIGCFILFFIIVSAANGGSSTKNSSTNSGSSSSSKTSSATATSNNTTTKNNVRKVVGTAVTLGAGTFTGGKDVVVGLYDVTTGSGQSGNFIVSGADSYNEILGVSDGQGVSKVRVKISNDDKISISGLSNVIFTPVTTEFATTYATTTLYAGTFTVGEDVVAGRYTVAPGSNESGNFIVSGADIYNEILGSDTSMGEVPSASVTLADGDVISIYGMNQVTLTPSK